MQRCHAKPTVLRKERRKGKRALTRYDDGKVVLCSKDAHEIGEMGSKNKTIRDDNTRKISSAMFTNHTIISRRSEYRTKHFRFYFPEKATCLVRCVGKIDLVAREYGTRVSRGKRVKTRSKTRDEKGSRDRTQPRRK